MSRSLPSHPSLPEESRSLPSHPSLPEGRKTYRCRAMRSSCVVNKSNTPAHTTFSVSINSFCGSISVNLPTLSCGKNVHKLLTWIPISWTFWWINACVATSPASLYEDRLLARSKSRRMTMFRSPSCFPFSSISTQPFSLSRITKHPTPSPRSRALALDPSPRAMAHKIVDLPLPLGPTTTFNLGPGRTSASAYVRKLCMRMRRIEPGL